MKSIMAILVQQLIKRALSYHVRGRRWPQSIDRWRAKRIGMLLPAPTSVDSDPDEEPLAIHPVEREPVDQHDGDTNNEGFESRAENTKHLVPEVDVQIFNDEVFPKVCDEVSGH